MYLVAPPVARRGVKRSSRSRVADSACVQGRHFVQVSEVTHSNEYIVTRNFSRLTLYRMSKCHSGLSGDTENRPPARSRRCLIQKTVRPFCPSPTSTKVRCFLPRATQGLISEGRKYFTVTRMHSGLFDYRAIDVPIRNKKARKL